MANRMGRKPKRYSQTERVLRMILMLGSRPVATRELAQDCGITVRQVYRDLAQIERAGIPLISDDAPGERVWRVEPGFRWRVQQPPTAEELMALYLARSHLAYLEGTPFAQNLDALCGRIKDILPAGAVNHLDRVLQVFVPRPRPLRAYHKRGLVLAAVQKALLLQRPVTIRHQAGGYDRPVTHRVDPYCLLLFENGLYLAGYSHRARARRIFAVERIRSAKVEMNAGPINIPADVSRWVRSSSAFGLIEGNSLKVRIRFDHAVAYFLTERRWHPTQKVRRLENGDVIVKLDATGLDEIASWVLSWGEYAQVLGPPELVKEVSTRLAAASRRYTPKPR